MPLAFGVAAVLGILLVLQVAHSYWHNSHDQKLIGADVFYSNVPGLDVGRISGSQRTNALADLNRSSCTCGCKMTVAHCRHHDRSCQTSVRLANEWMARYATAGATGGHSQ